ncbi:hypothetical protein GE061_015068 [Apolygus lucorum]|uniref:Major facilitator superfamily (MFS) profile domain-containing protein n=1 Tax=Apolygus lucorum TaxID=248454 RepID=A0A8S9XM10_APOLU|nr:hypothetical protein GE061_015068 [Apolygus lucorum]
MKINKNFLLMKLYFFCYNGGTSPIVPYIPIMAKSIGYSTTHVGALLTTIPILSLLTKPLFGSIADKFSIHKMMFLVIIAVNTLCFFNFQWVVDVPLDRTVLVECGETTNVIIRRSQKLSDVCYKNKVISAINGSKILCEMNCYDSPAFDGSSYNGSALRGQSLMAEMEYSSSQFHEIALEVKSLKRSDGSILDVSCPALSTSPCSLFCSDETMRNLIVRTAVDEKDAPNHSKFWIFAILVVVGRVAMFNALTIGDTVCLKLLGGKPELFGHQRSFGAIGWGLIGLLAGVIADWYSRGKDTTDYLLNYYLSLFLLSLSIVFGSMLKYEKEVKSAKLFDDVKQAIVRSPQFMLFLVTSVFLGALSGMVWNFLIWYIEEISNEDICADKGWIKTLQGVVLFVHTFAGEIPFFMISGWIIRKIGHTNSVALVALTFCVRFILISFVTNPWWLLPIEVTNGITYGLYMVASATYTNKVAPPGTQATVQGIVASIFDGLGITIGTFIAGIVIDLWGGRNCFFMAGIAAGVVTIFYTVLKTYLAKVYPEDQTVIAVKTTE